MWLCIMHASIWVDAVHPRLNDVHQATVWFNAVYQASIWLNAMHQALLWHNMPQCCAGINLRMVYIRHHNAAQTVHYVSVTLDFVHPCMTRAMHHTSI